MTVKEKVETFPPEIAALFSRLKNIVFEVAPMSEERMWAGLPSYYVGDAFVRLIPFKDHINVEAATLSDHKSELSMYKFTPKNLLQIYIGEEAPLEILSAVFRKTLVK